MSFMCLSVFVSPVINFKATDQLEPHLMGKHLKEAWEVNRIPEDS